MKTTRRSFVKTGVIVGSSFALPAVAQTKGMPASSAARDPAVGTDSIASTRGIGLYPGAAHENFDPTLILDPAAPYRNLALLRPAFASSSYDYNLTAQLVTDGLIDTHLPEWIVTIVNGSVLPRHQREIFVDHFRSNLLELEGSNPSVELHLGGGVQPPEIDRLVIFAVVPANTPPETLLFTVSISDDGHLWQPAGTTHSGAPLAPEDYPPDMTRGAILLAPSISLPSVSRSRYYRVDFSSAPAAGASSAPIHWRVGQLEFFKGSNRINLGGPYSFTSAWKAASFDQEWVYVDLGAPFTFDRVALHWIAPPAEGKLQTSDDALSWRDLQPLPAAAQAQPEAIHDVALPPTRARFIRALMTRPATSEGYILSEFQVFGHGGFLIQPAPPPPVNDAQVTLSGGHWRLQRAPQVEAAAAAIATAGFADHTWLPATVPGTILTSYFNAGAIADPNFGENQLHISDSFFYADFWYRTEFDSPTLAPAQLAWLCFEGVNWKADVFLNGKQLGSIAGGFTRGRFEVSSLLNHSGRNALAVLIHRNATPGSCKQKTWESTGKNGGGLGADNPTFHASVGWDWIPTIRGRNTGIWAEVQLQTTGPVTLEDPLVTSDLALPTPGHADITIEIFAVNNGPRPVTGTLHGTIAAISLSQSLTLAPGERRKLTFTPATHPQLRIANPQLWWPVDYGEPTLHDVALQFDSHGTTHHRLAFKAGIRQMTATEDGGRLRLFINGRRFIARGGNWGFGESMLRYRAREYDAAVLYHREQNFTMIRNWVGQIGDDAFYEACDRHGLVVWQDFWLANPWDGPVPDDDALFLANARDTLLRIRRHASIGLYCGRNEWFPPATLETGLRALLKELHPDIHYIGSSADGPVSGHGPYHTLSAPDYFRIADSKLHSEIGAPTIPPIESVRSMMPASALWPQGLDWGLHDFTLSGAQGGQALLTLIEQAFGGADNAEEWITLAQFLNYESYRAMFEAQSTYRMGLLLWMSHPCWPSFVWQTYDYYFEPTSAYFACKKASEPLHIQWNSDKETIEVVNYSAGTHAGLSALVELHNLDGKLIQQQTFAVESSEDSTITVASMHYPGNLTAVHFIRLALYAAPDGTQPISTNFYMRGLQSGDYRAIRTLDRATLHVSTTTQRQQDRWLLTSTVRNTSSIPALMVRLIAIRQTTGDRILPALYQDNYFALMPGETRIIETRLRHEDTRSEAPQIILRGFNVVSA